MTASAPTAMHAFDDIAGTLKTGDLFVAHGDSAISKVIEAMFSSEWSHSGMVVLASDLGLDLPVNVLLWESTRSTELPDIVTGSYKKDDPKRPGGTFLVDLRKRLAYDMTIEEMPVAFRRMNVTLSPAMLDGLKATMNAVRGAHFPADEQFAHDFWEGRRHNRAPSGYDRFFCSELVAYTLMKMNLLATDKVPTWYEPKSYSTENAPGIELLQGATLGEQVWVDRVSAT